jgi:hypothetical protein
LVEERRKQQQQQQQQINLPSLAMNKVYHALAA